MRALLFATACAAAQITTSFSARAQTPEPQGAQPRSGNAAAVLEEIIVTAERRRTNLQTTPIAATVMTGETLANSGVTSVDQLQFISYTHRSSFLHTLRLLQADVMGFAAADSVLAVVPMFHANAWGLPFAAPAAGARLVLPGRQMDGGSLARLIRSEGVTVAVGVPTVWLGLVDYLDAGGDTGGAELLTLERIIVGGSPMPPALMKRLERRLGVSVQTSWGMTELSPLGTMAPARGRRSATLSGQACTRCGSPADRRRWSCVGASQRDVEGHLRVRGASVIERYFGDDGRATDADGWFNTGDLARIDSEGHLVIIGSGERSDQVRRRMDQSRRDRRLSSVRLPLGFPGGRHRPPDPKWGERPGARGGAARAADDQ